MLELEFDPRQSGFRINPHHHVLASCHDVFSPGFYLIVLSNCVFSGGKHSFELPNILILLYRGFENIFLVKKVAVATKFPEHLTFEKLFQAFICFWPDVSWMISHKIWIRLILEYCHVQLSKNNHCGTWPIILMDSIEFYELSCLCQSFYLPSSLILSISKSGGSIFFCGDAQNMEILCL